MRNIIPILNYPNLFGVGGSSIVYLYEIQLKSKKKVILKHKINKPKKYKDKAPYIFSLSCADILYFFQDNFFIYNIKYETFTYKKFNLPLEKKYELLKHNRYIIKIIEYKKNELIILVKDIIYGENIEYFKQEFINRSSIILYDIETCNIKKIYLTTENSGIVGTNDYAELDLTNFSFSNFENIFIINNSIVYIKDNQEEYTNINYSLYIINILNGDIKYKFGEYGITSKNTEFRECGILNKSIYLCDNIFLFNGYELRVTKKGVNKIKLILYMEQI